MRLFVAVDFEELKDQFKGLQEKLKESGVKMTFPKAFHITLKFLGEVEEDKLESIKEALKKVKFDSFTAKTKGIGVFPSETFIKVVWIGLEDGKHLVKLQEQIEELMEKEGFKKEEREFIPHVTIARVKFIENDKKKEFSDFVKKIKVEEKEVEVKNFKLIKSELTPEGAVYTDVEVFELS